jgi:hypothetical protein
VYDKVERDMLTAKQVFDKLESNDTSPRKKVWTVFQASNLRQTLQHGLV